MKIVAVTRLLNEDDIVEPFIRHHAGFVDMHLVLDNGSTDRSIDILRSLRAEGANLQVFQNESVIFSETQFNTTLYRLACQVHQADWVLFLDADEFIDARRVGDLRAHLDALPATTLAIATRLINYEAATDRTAGEVNVVRRMVRRAREPTDIPKVFVRGGIPDGRVLIGVGNHSVFIDGAAHDSAPQDRLLLAHFANRSPFHFAAKAVSGRLKVLAAGETEAARGWNNHYTGVFEAMKTQPAAWLQKATDQAAALPGVAHLVDDPIDYGGGELRFTARTDYAWRGLASLLASMEQLALAHGRFLERNEAVREKVYRDMLAIRLIV